MVHFSYSRQLKLIDLDCPSQESTEEPLESGDEIYFPALHVGEGNASMMVRLFEYSFPVSSAVYKA